MKNRIHCGDWRGGILALIGGRKILPLAAAMWLLSAWTAAAQSSASGPFEDIQRNAAKVGSQKEAVEDVFIMSQGAIKRLGKIGVPAIPDIQSVLADRAKDWKVKAMMCEALGKIDDAASASVLEQVIQDGDQEEFVRAVAGHALAAMGRSDTGPFIERIVSSKSTPSSVRARIMMAVGATGFDDVDWLKRAAVGEGIEFHAGKELSQEQAQQEAGIILNAQRALGMSKNPKALDALIELQEQHPTNAILTDVLARKKDPRTIPVLLKVLTYQGPGRRASDAADHAATGLGELKAQEAVGPLIEIVMNDPDELLVGEAALALATIGDKSAIGPIQQVVENLHSDKRFTYVGDAYFNQAKLGNGPIAMLEKALAELHSK